MRSRKARIPAKSSDVRRLRTALGAAAILIIRSQHEQNCDRPRPIRPLGGQTEMPPELGACACLNPFDQAATAFSDTLRILVRVTLGGVSFRPGATHVSVVKLHGLRHLLTPFGRRQHSGAPRQNALATS